MITTKYHSASEIGNNAWKISESGMVNCYLLLGNSGALLIDTGIGLGNVKEIIDKITALPITVVLTHMHPDHAGGLSHFHEYYVMKEDFAMSYSFLSMPVFSRIMIKMSKIKDPIMPKLFYHSVRHELIDGQMFNLGGRTVHAMAVPGHTKGSAVFIDDANKMIFTGDDINISLWMHLPGCTGMKTWQTGAKKIIEYFEKGYSGWDGHSEGQQTEEQVKTTYHLSEELIQEAEEGTLDKKENFIPNKDTFPQIRYQPKRILQ